jgi:hypothetical protein
VVDETMVDLWYNAPPPPPLAAFNPDAPVITIGSAGKSFWGDCASAGSALQHAPSPRYFRPAILSIWVRRCWNSWPAAGCWKMPGLLPPRRAMLAARRDMCGALMTEYFPHWRFTPPEGGLSFGWNYRTCWRPLLCASGKPGIHIGTGTRFGLAGAFDRYLRLPLPWTMSIAQRIYHAAIWAGLATE